jgi:dTDP-4-amino-4,6-dideoxygalactose transaminase
VDYAGSHANIQARTLADQHKLMIIEDASHALGATYKGRKIQTLHEFTTLSFIR